MTTLKAALQEAYFMELEEIPSEEKLSEDEALTFSSAFERRMKKLIRRADHPIRYRIAQAAACLLLAALLSGCTVLAVSPEARAAFVGWVRETYETWFVYRYTGEEQLPSENIVYAPTRVPDGYRLITAPEAGTHSTAIYENPEGDIIIFNCSMNTESINLQIDHRNTQLIPVNVSDISADLHLDNTSGNTNYLVWEDENKQMIFWIASTLDGETMIKMAESVEAQEVPKPQVVYQPTWIPEGYSELKQSVSDDQVVIVYRNDEGYLLSFTYTKNRESVSAYVLLDNQETDVQAVLVGGKTADLYLEQQADKTSVLVWGDDEKGVFFAISAHCSGEELIKIAESVEAVQ